MPSYSQLDGPKRIDEADRALRALADDPDMLARMDVRGYKPPRLAEGRALVEAARAGRRTQDREHGEKLGATDSAGAAWLAARRPYMKEVKLARIKLKGDRAVLEDLGLLDARERSRSRALDQAHNFYASALARPDLIRRLGEIGISEEALGAGLARMEAVQRARGVQQGEKEGAKTATKRKSTALADLDAWMARFLGVARAEFADEPERLARLGI